MLSCDGALKGDEAQHPLLKSSAEPNFALGENTGARSPIELQDDLIGQQQLLLDVPDFPLAPPQQLLRCVMVTCV